MKTHHEGLAGRFPLNQIVTGIAGVVAGTNVVLSAILRLEGDLLPLAVAGGTLSVSTKILGILVLQCALAHAIGLLFGRMTRARSLTTALPAVVGLSLVAPWVAVANIHLLLAPSFTFVAGSVVMTNPYIAVIVVYLACALVSLGFIFANVKRHAENEALPLSAERFAILASGVQSLVFVLLGVLAAV